MNSVYFMKLVCWQPFWKVWDIPITTWWIFYRAHKTWIIDLRWKVWVRWMKMNFLNAAVRLIRKRLTIMASTLYERFVDVQLKSYLNISETKCTRFINLWLTSVFTAQTGRYSELILFIFKGTSIFIWLEKSE